MVCDLWSTNVLQPDVSEMVSSTAHGIDEPVGLHLVSVPVFLKGEVLFEVLGTVVGDTAHDWISHVLLEFKAIIFTAESVHCLCIVWMSPLKVHVYIKQGLKNANSLALRANRNNCARESARFSIHFNSLLNIKTEF